MFHRCFWSRYSERNGTFCPNKRSYLYVTIPVGVALAMKVFAPGDPVALLIDRVFVKWAKGSEFGVDFNTLLPKAVEQITTVISTLIKTDHDSSRHVI